MLLPKPLKKFVSIFRGGVSPLMITISILLGFSFGMIPGFYGIHAVILVLFLLLNVHLGLFLISAGLAKSLCLAIAPLMYHAGMFVQNHVSGLLTLLSRVPILGLTDFSRYSVAAAILIGPAIGLILGLVMARMVISFRKKWASLEEGSEAFKKFSNNRLVMIMDRILIGKRTKDVKQALEGKSPTIRKAGVGLAVVVLVISAIAMVVVQQGAFNDYAMNMLSNANGAEVNAESIKLSPLSGALSATGIQVTDPANPERNQIVIGKVTADANIYNLLTGKVIINELELSNVEFDTQRATPGKVTRPPVAEAGEEPFDPAEHKIPAGDISKLETYFENAKQLKEWLAKIQKYLPESKDKATPETQQIPEGYLEFLKAKAITSPTVKVLVKRIVMDGVDIPGEQFGKCKIVITNVNDAPQVAALPITFEIQSQEDAQSLNMTCDFDSSDGAPGIKGDFDGIDLAKFQSKMSGKNPLVFQGGTASGKFVGTASKDFLDINIGLKIQDMKAASSGKGMLGLDARTTSEVLGVLNNLQTNMQLVGPTSDPRLVLDTKGLTRQFQDALVEAGKERLQNELQKQIDDKLGDKLDEKLGDKIPTVIKDALKKPDELIKGIGDLFGGKKKEK